MASASSGQLDNPVTYQWAESTDGVNFTNIAGANGSSYAVQNGDAGQALEVVATATNINGVTVSATSAVTVRPTVLDLANSFNASYDAGFSVTAGAAVTVTDNGTLLTLAQLTTDFAMTTSGGRDIYTALPNDFTGGRRSPFRRRRPWPASSARPKR